MLNLNILAILFVVLFVNQCASEGSSKCETAKKCGECIQIPNCVWYYEQNLNLEASRCIHRKQSVHRNVTNPENKLNIIENNGGHIKPQRITLAIRKGVPIVLNFTYARPKNYPVDLYFLMDFTHSMREHRNTLASTGMDILKTMQTLTSDIKMGFGSFVDKVTLPYVNIDKLDNPCYQQKNPCGRPYSFKNHLSLTEDVNEFSEQVSNPKLSGNIDYPEGGLDALMQAIVCQKEIGWRDKAYRLIVFSTDDTYHIAGDGKLAGIVEPNDCKCHMEDNEYTHGLLQDYPSIGQINAVAKRHNIIILFAVTEGKFKIYDELRKKIKDAKIGIVSSNSNNIVELLEESYLVWTETNITDSIQMYNTFDKKYFDVKIESNCAKAPGSKGNNFECTNIKSDDITEYNATITLKECPKNQEVLTYQIKPSGISDNLTIDVNLQCTCPCEHRGDSGFDGSSAMCNGNGNMECGTCNCGEGKLGFQCECSESHRGVSSINSNKCTNNSTGQICSDLGECKCGQCNCHEREDRNERIYGSLCECDNYSCPRRENAVCSGNGQCDCKKCICDPGWTGEACDCLDNDSACQANGTICSGRGQCLCSKCNCHDNNYSGPYCEECRTCVQCNYFRPCVECQAYNEGTYNETECKNICVFELELTEELQEGLNNCSYSDDKGCTFFMQYRAIPYENQLNYYIYVPKEKTCPFTANATAFLTTIIGTILFAGLMFLLAWKAITMYQDKIEFSRFSKETEQTQWAPSDNPMFVQAVTTFSNPMYGEK